jgi:hypothetical protein
MKKALVVLLALACVAGLAFADGATAKWSVSNLYGFGVIMPNDTAIASQLWAYDYSQVGNGRTRLVFNYTSADGNAGFNSRLQITDGATAFGQVNWNQVNGWGKLFGGMLTVRGGKLDDYTIATTDWQTFGTTDGSVGVYFNVTPMAGLDIGFFQTIPVANGAPLNMNGDIVGLAFAMPNLVSIQAGVKLDNTVSAGAGNQIYFGANLKAVPNLTAILEGDVMLANGGTLIVLEQNVGYAMGALTVGARVGEYSDGITSKLDWGVEPTVAYKINDNFTVNVIANVYSINSLAGNPITGGTSTTTVTFMSPIDGWAATMTPGSFNGDINFGGGLFVTYSASGFTLTVGDYYGAGTTKATSVSQANLFFVNADLSL